MSSANISDTTIELHSVAYRGVIWFSGIDKSLFFKFMNKNRICPYYLHSVANVLHLMNGWQDPRIPSQLYILPSIRIIRFSFINFKSLIGILYPLSFSQCFKTWQIQRGIITLNPLTRKFLLWFRNQRNLMCAPVWLASDNRKICKALLVTEGINV